MQALKQRQLEQAKLRDILNTQSTEKTIEERVERCKELQYEKHQQLFAVSYTDIHKAAADNSLAGMKYFLQQGSRRGGGGGGGGVGAKKAARLQILEELNKNGMSPFHCAADKGAMDVLAFLLENECRINIQSREGNTALMYACKASQLSAIRFLVEQKADVLATNQCGMNCIHFAAQCDNHLAIAAVVDSMRHFSSSALTARSEEDDGSSADENRMREDRSDVEAGAHGEEEEEARSEFTDTNQYEKQLQRALSHPSNNKTTPLHIACSYGAERTVEVLIRSGADINTQDSSGDTPLHKAARNSYYQIYRFLLVNGASDEITNHFRETAADCLVDAPTY